MMLTRNYAEFKSRVAAHIEADAVIAGHYWSEHDNEVGGTGCFIGCLTHSYDDTKFIERDYGIPSPVVRLADGIFENLSEKAGVEFFAGFAESVGGDDKDLTGVPWLFVAEMLKSLPHAHPDIQRQIDALIVGLSLLAEGKAFPRDELLTIRDEILRIISGGLGRSNHAEAAPAFSAVNFVQESIIAPSMFLSYCANAQRRLGHKLPREIQAATLLRVIKEAPFKKEAS